MGEKPKMRLIEAIYHLCQVHTREDYLTGFVVMSGASPGIHSMVKQSEYIEAWQVLREQASLPVEITPPSDAPQPAAHVYSNDPLAPILGKTIMAPGQATLDLSTGNRFDFDVTGMNWLQIVLANVPKPTLGQAILINITGKAPGCSITWDPLLTNVLQCPMPAGPDITFMFTRALGQRYFAWSPAPFIRPNPQPADTLRG